MSDREPGSAAGGATECDALGLLTAELRRLYEAAGSPKLAALVHRGQTRRPTIKLSDATVSDWLSGKSVPSAQPAFEFLIGYLETEAAAAGPHTPRGLDWWLRLRQRAWDQTHTNRGGRPRRAKVTDDHAKSKNPYASPELERRTYNAQAQARHFAEHDISHLVIPLRCSTSLEELKNPTSTADPWLVRSVEEAINAGAKLVFVLGDVGSGKTWFLKKMHLLSVAEHLKDHSKDIPQYVDLGQCLLPPGTPGWPWSWADMINSEGPAKRLLLLDAFDEAVAKSPPGSRLKLFESIMSVAADRQLIITSRSNLFETKERLHRLIGAAWLTGTGKRRGTAPAHVILVIRPLSDTDVEQFLSQQFNDKDGEMWRRMRSIIDLADLAKRPVLLPMVAESLTTLEVEQSRQDRSITSGRLYRIYTERWFSRESWRLKMNHEASRHFLEDLSLYFHNHATDSIPFDEIADRFPRYFPTDFWSPEREAIGEALRSASFLTNDDTGDYRFAHRSFLEYFLAERLVRAFRRSQLNLPITHFPSKVTDYFVLDLLANESKWSDFLLTFARLAEAPILRYLAVYLVSRLATDRDRSELAAKLQGMIGQEANPFVVRELLVALISLGEKVSTVHLENHLTNPIPSAVIQDELKDYYGSLEEARRYLRTQLEPGRLTPMQLFYLISLASICTIDDVPLLDRYRRTGAAHESKVATEAIRRMEDSA